MNRKFYFSKINNITKIIEREKAEGNIVNLKWSLEDILNICNISDIEKDNIEKGLEYYANLIRVAINHRRNDIKISVYGNYIYIFDSIIANIRYFPQYILYEIDYLNEIMDGIMDSDKESKNAIQQEVNVMVGRYSKKRGTQRGMQRRGQLNLYSGNSLYSRVQIAMLKK